MSSTNSVVLHGSDTAAIQNLSLMYFGGIALPHGLGRRIVMKRQQVLNLVQLKF